VDQEAKGALPAAFELLDRELGGRAFLASAFRLAGCEVIPFIAGPGDFHIEVRRNIRTSAAG
jgi:hypothetical protein